MKVGTVLALCLAIGSAAAQAGLGLPKGAVILPNYIDPADVESEDTVDSENDTLAKRYSPAVTKDIADWKGKCVAKKPAIANAINHFCTLAGPSNHVPRDWTLHGAHSDDSKFDPGALVSIGGSCFPQQWVPMKYCYLQFYKMCVQNPASTGGGGKNFGKNGCQSWWIERYSVPGKFYKVASMVMSII